MSIKIRKVLVVSITIVLLSMLHIFPLQGEYEEDSPYLFRIEIDDCLHAPKAGATDRFQTGFQIEGIRGIVTTLHGVADCDTITAKSTAKGSDKFEQLEIIQANLALDLAVLASKEVGDNNLGFKAANSSVINNQSEFYIIGHPYGSYGQLPRRVTKNLKERSTLENILEVSFSDELSKRQSPSPTISFMLLQGAILPGDSGSPVFDQNDQIVGVVDGGIVGGTGGIGWAIPWSLVGEWQEPKGALFEKLKQHEVDKLFAFGGDERDSVVKLSIRIDGGGSFLIQIPVESESKTYDLRRFNVPPVTVNEVDVSIENEEALNVIARGRIDAINRNLQILDANYRSAEIDISRGFILLRITFANNPLRPTAITNPESPSMFTVKVIDVCTGDPIPNAIIDGELEYTDGAIIPIENETTDIEGEVFIDLREDFSKINIVITNIRATGYHGLLADKTIQYLKGDSHKTEIGLRQENQRNCAGPRGTTENTSTLTPTQTPATTFTTTPTPTVIPSPTQLPTPTFTAPQICIVPNRIAKGDLAEYFETDLETLDKVNPGLPDLIEIDTIIVIPPNTQQVICPAKP